MIPLERYCNRAHQMRTCSIEWEHFRSNENIFYQMQTYFIKREHILAQLKHTAIHTHLNRYSVRGQKLLDASVFYETRTYSMRQEHILWDKNIFYETRTYSFSREHILSVKIIFYHNPSQNIQQSTHSKWEHIPLNENIFYQMRTYPITHIF